MFLNSGYRKSGFADAVTPCSFSAAGPGRITAAEWIRTVFHDMITGDIYPASGGLDASIMFETDRSENVGAAFNSSLAFFANYYSTRASISDLIAVSMYTATRSCGGPVVPIRAGRIDATVAGPEGFVPVPQGSTSTFETQFARTGFSTSDMITMTACGHTIGGVHGADFSQIVPLGSAPNNYAAMDSTIAVFDNKIAVEWIAGNTADPLTVGPSVAASSNSDAKVFGADQNVTMQALTNPATFASSCASIFQRMIEIVPPEVTFTPFIVPYEVKPSDLQLTLLSGGASISFTGFIRVRTTVRPASNIASVQLTYKDRTGGNACGACIIQTSSVGSTTGFDDSFVVGFSNCTSDIPLNELYLALMTEQFYSFSSTIPSDTSISSFNVVIDLVGGGTELYDNNGNGFPVQDSIMLQSPQSCLNQGNLKVVAAVSNVLDILKYLCSAIFAPHHTS
jgi:Peroxidase